MNKDKQIEEMAKELAIARDCICTFGTIKNCNNCTWRDGCYFIELAKILDKKGYRKASDVAREIFEEIESLLATYTYEDNYGNYISTGLADEFAELKKKYTEDGK